MATGWKRPGCREVCRPVRTKARVFTAWDVGRIAEEAVMDGAGPDEVCIALMTHGIDCCEEVRSTLDDVLVSQEKVKDLLAAAEEALEKAENEVVALEVISWLALLPGMAALMKSGSAIMTLWRAKNAEAEALRIIERLKNSSKSMSENLGDYAKEAKRELERFTNPVE